MTIRIGNGAGFWGDNLDAPIQLAESGDLDYLTLEYLAELTMSILARIREKNPNAGYATDFLSVVERLSTLFKVQALNVDSINSKLRMVTNAGGMNPLACAKATAEILVANELSNLRIGMVRGDDLLDRIAELQAEECEFTNLDTGQPLSDLTFRIVSANAYLGAQPIVEALQQDASIVITGRVADASLTVGPCVHEFGWDWQDWNRLAGASVAGHLIECGAQVTGGLSQHWQELDFTRIGYPIAEVSEDGNIIITKPNHTSGQVDRETVISQLVYEIGDPKHYLTPDVDVDFTSVQVTELTANRVEVTQATGNPSPDQYKVSLAYLAGYAASGQLLIYGRNCIRKAKVCAEIIRSKLIQAGYELDSFHVECLGSGDGVPGITKPPSDLQEVMLRISVQDERKTAVERFTKEFAPLITSGPAGIAGYANARAVVRPVFAYWPTLIPKNYLQAECVVKTAANWVKE